MRIIKKIMLAASALVVVSCGSNQVALKQTGQLAVSSTNKEASLAMELHREVNKHRASQGLKPLEYHKGLAKIAKPHSNYMKQHAGSFSVDAQKKLITHYGFDARVVMADRKYRIESLSENVIASYNMGQGNDLAAKMVRGWMTSPNHRHNILSKWSQTGIGVSFDEQGRAFVTQLFGSAPSQVSPVGGPLPQW